MNKKLMGYTSLEGANAEKPTSLKFYFSESGNPAEAGCEYFVKASIELGFKRFSVDRLLYFSKEHCNIVSNLFIKVFRPHAVGRVHLGDQIYILTRERYMQTEKEFYWIYEGLAF